MSTVLKCGLIGGNISRTRLPFALDIMCKANGLTLDFTPIDTEHDDAFDFSGTVDMLRQDGWTGVSVTHPHKTEAAGYAGRRMDRAVDHLGASNLLLFKPELSGWNTDYLGFIAAWQAVFRNRGPGEVAVAGAGGVARAIVPALIRLGARKVTVWDLNFDAAKELARMCGRPVTAIPIEEAPEAIASATGLVNATALGMGGHPGTAFDPTLVGPQWWAFDAVYTPTDTAFLTDAAAKGLKILTGFDLFRFMAIETFRVYTGLTPDRATILPQLDTLRPKDS
ncbi:shikimate dehydrogenase family protein [Silicimonas sp. MF1-12-2]|uniref:shikimate dehydrogenase family protein n=1 Tax=Silicimonas sp. MF1-12-2 TaxID=3384793 RepID=UPI0039B545D8